jgi:hypothetical protein
VHVNGSRWTPGNQSASVMRGGVAKCFGVQSCLAQPAGEGRVTQGSAVYLIKTEI